jgi:hypothetical protein
MGQKTRLFGLSNRRLIRAILLVSNLLFYALPAVLANSGTSGTNVINGRGCQEVAQATDTDGRPSYTLSAGYAPEEALLDSAFNFLKARDINGAVSNLQELTREFPDNEDYSLLLKMGQKRQGAQQWYRYQEWVERKQKYSRPYAELSRRLTKDSYGPGRVNELKRSIWQLLASDRSR